VTDVLWISGKTHQLAEFRPQLGKNGNVGRPEQESLYMTKRTSALIEKLVSACHGDLHAAVRALLVVNEELERENQELHAAVVGDLAMQRAHQSLH
jgi:hypothetical protein